MASSGQKRLLEALAISSCALASVTPLFNMAEFLVRSLTRLSKVSLAEQRPPARDTDVNQ